MTVTNSLCYNRSPN